MQSLVCWVRSASNPYSGHADPRMTSTKSVRTYVGQKWASTSAFTFPNVVSGRWAFPSRKASRIRRLKKSRAALAPSTSNLR